MADGEAARGARVLVDGRSGSGKTRLAAAVVAARPHLQLVRMDDLYPGWDGLAAGSRIVHDEVLAASAPGWSRFDWTSGRTAERHPLEAGRGILVEGVGALTRANRALADLAVWVDLDDSTRRARALGRDGDAYAPHWDRWAAQEERFIAAERPRDLADLVVSGADEDDALRAVLISIDRSAPG